MPGTPQIEDRKVALDVQVPGIFAAGRLLSEILSRSDL